ncbi:hypothetical protein [Companilactobacillus bobalius]|uniref:Uncharacterized protein n=2 Tax=Companilactobacillus bobalius TaxID=2801451 RepID=A0A202F3G5_9LACO|nr:hypothetical protein [Companilactobacillus bobalius]KRK84539.1 hypothetical protein FC78_GL000770 [Companilactobacillus bobalius DSM 19674]OVE94977.1 hypothetical protein LKACC16343_02778 [Companilactobacillus bobalius]GEO59574.1 hypothetical protein LBO01_27030 [Companilactobacillus paralimentarius]
MEDIRRIADPITKEFYYPQTHYLAVIDLDNHIKDLMNQNNTYAKYVKDMELIDTSGPFYFDENTLNKPANIPKGYLRATFIDSKNGIVEIITTNEYYEFTDGEMSELKESDFNIGQVDPDIEKHWQYIESELEAN